MSPRILCSIGTRPEAIKMAPVILALRAHPEADVRVLATAQHRELLDEVLDLFDIRPDIDLDLMEHDQKLPELTARLITPIDEVLERERPDIMLAEGDTTTVFVSALAAFYRSIPFGHVEAGLRTGKLGVPFPEEMNRTLTSRLARWHFAPTQTAAASLRNEGVPADRIHITGNPVIDALLMTAEMGLPLHVDLDPKRRLVLVTAHRRENFGAPFLQVCRALRTLADRNPDIEILYPVHPNPNVVGVAARELAAHPRIKLCDPLPYGSFITAMKRSTLILTDSGGVQEEAPSLAKPVLLLRSETERPEAVAAGVVKLVGPVHDRIVSEAERLLRDEDAYKEMARGVSPYGDGKAAARITDVLLGG
ncbi:MAG: UDP-N-acetylglucosamine 2-epimerase (non-hydrolyzing) [Myxococcales bacterium]|nr:UDP-N-acetylglucosamine 2-epimerase (non-hydrolyzing) [Myxococcales bacterium]